MEIGLSLGSNLGDRIATFREAAVRLAKLPGLTLRAAAPVYETDPVDARPEYAHLKFLNTVLIAETTDDALPLPELGRRLHEIEEELGRIRQADRNAPRTLDIDVLFAGSLTQSDGILDLPHPRWATRRFVVQPLADVRPGLVLPGETRTVADLLAGLPPAGIKRVFDAHWLPANLLHGGYRHAV